MFDAGSDPEELNGWRQYGTCKEPNDCMYKLTVKKVFTLRTQTLLIKGRRTPAPKALLSVKVQQQRLQRRLLLMQEVNQAASLQH